MTELREYERDLNFSKSKYVTGCQCPKMLWMQKYRPETFDDSVLNQMVFDQGNQVGKLAQGLFGDCEVVSYEEDKRIMVEETRRLIEAGAENIAEASFLLGGLYCAVDLLHRVGDNEFEIYEVKSSTIKKDEKSGKDGVPDVYKVDTGFQYYVLTRLGYTISKVCIVRLDSDYVLEGELDIHKLFFFSDVTEDARAMYDEEIPGNLEHFKEVLSSEEEPEDMLGPQCKNPYDCGFKNQCISCWNSEEPMVFDLTGQSPSFKEKIEFYREGCITFSQLETELKKTNEERVAEKKKPKWGRALMQIESELHDSEVVDKEGIEAFLKKVKYPVGFLDFESILYAVPQYEGMRPYQQVVFQYSLHKKDAKDADAEHMEYLAYADRLDIRDLAEHLISDCEGCETIIVYNETFEKGRLEEMADMYPELAEGLKSISERVVDLMKPFGDRLYYNKAMKGSYSIKYVLPAVFPDDPELNYSNLEGPQRGDQASEDFKKSVALSGEELETYRKNALAYCGLDTFGTVKLMEFLESII